ncbi:hydantoinase/oxoprolinase N-terminal domain-containing protein [Hephaestia sp. GCM10023244]|uniref:hydantoinase/oxoprolinase family protein n=1 Tax=unclassified Hephaestia TaxID=2631281 RepID=UPI002076E568|nr:hydantoinase/oxoprolinase family protein [Hephaestia sp. MAHUQ-44]MCM8732474.1 hydantoinase/oxoprolinase family protein [Hephaestia sp. MAHUQ-44]
MRIGVDVGGTNTDAALISGHDIVAAVKRPTSADVGGGIVDAVQSLIRDADVDASDIEAVMIGTTHFTNAFVQRRDLTKVLAIRIGAPASRGIPPFSGWPRDVRDAVFGDSALIRGGFNFDGQQIADFDAEAVADVARRAADAGITQVAVSCIFSHLNAEQEVRAAEIIAEVAPGLGISLSSELGRAGLLERENAAIMNACLRPLASKVAVAFGDALNHLQLICPWYVSQNDGTLMSAAQLRRHPVLTFAAGPTNSLRGAAWLTGQSEAVVIDIGGTTTDIGVLRKGFPRQSSVHVDVGGVRTNFRMPDILSVGLGGGSLVVVDGDSVRVGPQSVGYALREKARVFGGATLTASDIAIASGWADFGDAELVANLDGRTLNAARREMARIVAEAIDRIKTTPGATPAILVGGGSILVGETPPGVSDLHRPDHAGVANAIGAAIGQVSGEIDRIYTIASPADREAAFIEARQLATQRVLDAGGTEDGLEIVDLEAIPLQYVSGGATRVICRAVSDLAAMEARA